MLRVNHDPLVLEYYEQPNRIKLQYQGPSGRNVTNWHPPDFLVLRQDGAVWEEWKPESTLVRLVADHPSRYQRSPSGGYRCPPGEAYAQALGLDYHVRSSAELPPLAIQNLMFLEDYWITPLAVPAVVADPLVAAVSASPGIALATVLQLTPEVRPNTIYALIAAERLYIDWSAAALGDQTKVRLYADAGSMPRVTPRLRSLSPLLQTALYWDGQPYLLIAQTEQGVQLQAEFGLPLDLPQDLFTQLLHSGAIRILTAADPAPLRREVRQIVAHTSPQAGTIAQERLLAVQSFLLDRPQGYAHVAGRTLRRWVTAFHAAEARYGSGFVGLIPQRSAQGNHTPRADETARSLLDQTIRDRYADPRQRKGKAVYLTYQSACATHGILPVSQRHFYRRLKELATPEVEAQRRGTRAVYAEIAPYWSLEATTPRHGDRPFAIAHLDHTVLDIEVVSSQTGRNLGRPWATFLMDAYSRRFLAVYLTFDPPSYRSCMMALRICVRQHHRLPQALVVDGGKDFASTYFDQLLARYSCVKKVRPPAQPRFGSVLERLFGTTNTQLLAQLVGNTQATKTPRQLTPTINPRRLAAWTLEALSDLLNEWAAQIYDQTDHPALGQTPREAFLQGLERTGERQQRHIAYDDVFLKDTLPTTTRGEVTIQPGKGIKLFAHWYWNDVFVAPALAHTHVPIRSDPFDIGVAYVFVQGQWITCQSEYYAQLHGRSERELQVITTELRHAQHADPQRQAQSMERLIAFWQRTEAHEQVLLQRMKDQESRPLREALHGPAAATTPVASSPAPTRTSPPVPPLDLESLVTYDEYE